MINNHKKKHNMPFEKGNKLGGRPKGSKNKATDVDKQKIQEII
jgi:hypothetical protein